MGSFKGWLRGGRSEERDGGSVERAFGATAISTSKETNVINSMVYKRHSRPWRMPEPNL